MLFLSSSIAETETAAEEICKRLYPGCIISFVAGLGAGKSVICRYIIKRLGVTVPIPSPSFTLINEYTGMLHNEEIDIYHIDLYRLNSEEEISDIGVEEILNSQGIALIEWGERAETLFGPDIKKVEIKITGETSRKIKISGFD